MKNPSLFFVIIFLTLSGSAIAQTAGFNTLATGFTSSVSHDTLSLSYNVTYKGKDASDSFSGYIITNYSTEKNKKQARAFDSVLVSKPIATGAGLNIKAHIKMNGDYFNNGDNNIIVIWPTGDKGGKPAVAALDSAKYPNHITVTNLGIAVGPGNTFNPVKIYPNPANTTLTVDLYDPTMVIVQLRIIDINGKVEMIETKNTSNVDVSRLKSGTYFIEVDAVDGKATYPFVISR